MEIQDRNGNWVCIDEHYLHQELASCSTLIHGVTLDEILDLLILYEGLGGTLPVTKEKVKNLLP